jgi:YHS domain-containing protein
MKRAIVSVVFVFLSFMLLAAGTVQQKSDEKVICPVTGETMLKSQAKASYEYEGKTYYFCCEGCKEKFVKDPAKYIEKKADEKEVYTCPMHPEVQSDKPGKCPKCGMNLEKKAMPMTQGQGMAHGQSGMGMMEGQTCPMMGMMGLKGVEIVSEKLQDGAVIKITAKDPETVKKIQEMAAKIKPNPTHEPK